MKSKLTKYGLMIIAAVLLVAMAFAGAASADHGIYGGKTAGVAGYGLSSADPINITSELDLYNLTQHSDDWKEDYYFILKNNLYLTNITSISSDTTASTVTVRNTAGSSMAYNWSSGLFDSSLSPSWHPGYNETLLNSGVSPSSPWEPIGNSYNQFNGTFDGNHKTIHGLFINATVTNQGLFGYTEGNLSIMNLTLKNSFVYSSGGGGAAPIVSSVGGLVGYANSGIYLDNCNVMNTTVAALHGRVGGMIGCQPGFVMHNLTALNCRVMNSTVAAASDVGGIFGDVWNKYFTVMNCSATDCVITGNGGDLGGLIGCVYESDQVNATDCYATGCTVTCSGSSVGGLFGSLSSALINATNCYATDCTVTGIYGDVGGLVGSGDNINATDCSATNCTVTCRGNSVGGVVGSGDNINATDCSATDCTVTGLDYGEYVKGDKVGGLVGSASSADVNDCSVSGCGNISGSNGVGGLVGSASSTDVNDCSVSDCGNISGSNGVGGLVGSASSTDVNDCSVFGCVNISGIYNVGGLFGFADSVDIKDCFVSNCGNISSVGTAAGGLIGKANSADVKNCSVSNCGNFSGSDIVGGLFGSADSVDIKDCFVSNCGNISGSAEVGGLVGMAIYADVTDCFVSDCENISGSYYVGGLFGTAYFVDINDSSVSDCENISDNGGLGIGMGLGGLFGQGLFGNVTNCSVTNCSVLAGFNSLGIGGLVGMGSYDPGIGGSYGIINVTDCSVSNCSMLGGSNALCVGGLIGLADPVNVTNCTVIKCDSITGNGAVGGLLGACGNSSIVNASSVRNSSVISTGSITSSQPFGGLIGLIGGSLFSGYIELDPSCELNANLLEEVHLNVTSDAQYAYLFDNLTYPINSSNGIAKVAQINLSHNNIIKNSSVVVNGAENPVLEGFSGLHQEFNLTVSNHNITSIGRDCFNTSYLTAIYDIPLNVTCINSSAFLNCTNLTGGIYVPGTVAISSDAFAGTENLAVIYGNTTAGLSGLVNSAVVNITSAGNITTITPGSFSVSGSSEMFKPVMLDSVPATRFKNLTTGSYLLTSDSWTADNIYLAVIAYTITNTSNDPFGGYTLVNKTGCAEVNDTVTSSAIANTGYYFVNWTCVNVTPSPDTVNPYIFTMPAMNVSLTANFAGNVTTVTYQNESGVTYDTKIYIFNESASLPVSPVKDGYTFNGWKITVGGIEYPFSGNSTYFKGGKWIYPCANETSLIVNASWRDIPQSVPSSSSHQTGYTVILTDPEESPQNETVVGTRIVVTVRGNNAVLPDAPVTFDGVTVGRTNETGKFTTSAVEAGASLVISSSLDGYVGTPVLCTVEPGVINEVTVELSETSSTPAPTPSSPVPFLGIIAGLGAAALFLGRLRR